MGWNWPALGYLFGDQAASVSDWVGKYGWVFWVILIIIIVIVAIWAFKALSGR